MFHGRKLGSAMIQFGAQFGAAAWLASQQLNSIRPSPFFFYPSFPKMLFFWVIHILFSLYGFFGLFRRFLFHYALRRDPTK
jgi:hypothetical protein